MGSLPKRAPPTLAVQETVAKESSGAALGKRMLDFSEPEHVYRGGRTVEMLESDLGLRPLPEEVARVPS